MTACVHRSFASFYVVAGLGSTVGFHSSMSLSFFKMNVNNSIPIDNRIIVSMTVLSAQYAIESQFVHICFESFVNF